MVSLTFVVFLLVMPPPFGTLVGALILGHAYGAPGLVQSAPPPAEDCNCGVPSSPRGPR